LYYSILLTSMFATVSTDIPSYEAIHGHMPLHYYSSYNLRYVSHTGFYELHLPTRHDTQSRARYHSDLGALNPKAKCHDKTIELMWTVAETILCEFQRLIGQRHVVTPTNDKSFRLEIYELQIPKRPVLSTKPRLTVPQTIPSWFQRPTGLETRQWPSQLRPIHTRTRRLPIAASMRFDKLPSNWVNWRLQGRFHSPYATESRVTGKPEAGPTSIHFWW
jgi:hypothetical protein